MNERRPSNPLVLYQSDIQIIADIPILGLDVFLPKDTEITEQEALSLQRKLHDAVEPIILEFLEKKR